MERAARAARQVLEGLVVSDKMDKTRVVAVRWTKRQPRYEKIISRTTKVHAHDEKNESKAGDRVRVSASRPISKTKCWRITAVIGRPAGA